LRVSAKQRISESGKSDEAASHGESLPSGEELAFWEGLADERLQVRLPSEAEWEKAARGGIEIPVVGASLALARVGTGASLALAQVGAGASPAPTVRNPNPQRRYPWGDEPDPNRANYDETGIGRTSAVGCFPGGASPYGCLDMAGNVFEWTASLWGRGWPEPEFRYPYTLTDGRENLEAGDALLRVVRGGSFYGNRNAARCASRYRNIPGSAWHDLGFRLVLSPSLESDR